MRSILLDLYKKKSDNRETDNRSNICTQKVHQILVCVCVCGYIYVIFFITIIITIKLSTTSSAADKIVL